MQGSDESTGKWNGTNDGMGKWKPFEDGKGKVNAMGDGNISQMYFSHWKPPGVSERMWSVN